MKKVEMVTDGEDRTLDIIQAVLEAHLKKKNAEKGGTGSGEREGHPFRGNQWTTGQSGSDLEGQVGGEQTALDLGPAGEPKPVAEKPSTEPKYGENRVLTPDEKKELTELCANTAAENNLRAFTFYGDKTDCYLVAKGLSDELRRLRAYDGIKKHSDNFGVVPGHNFVKSKPSIVVQNAVWVFDPDTGASMGGVRGAYSARRNMMLIAAKKEEGTSIHRTVDNKPLALGKGVFIVGDGSMKSTMRHEYGHLLYRQSFQGKESLEWDRVHREVNSEYKGRWGSHVSRYCNFKGMSQDQKLSERFAECFSAYTHPDYKPGMLHPKIEAFMKSIAGERR